MANQPASASFPLFGILGVLFVGLKLGGVGDVAGWSWWWVLAPFWGPLAFALAFALAALVLAFGLRKVARMIGAVSDGLESRRRLRDMMRD